ncbi:MAG: phosphatase PAP2 family protein [Acidimicrobiales bacterium]
MTPAPSGWRRCLLGPRLWWQELIALFICYEIFERLRGVIPEPPVSPFHHALQVVHLEQAVGLFHEAALQQWFLPWHLAIQAFDLYYGTVHFLVPPVALIILWKRDRGRYTFMRNSAGFMLVLAFAAFLLWPLAPPRLLPASYHFVDTPAAIGGMGPLDRGNLKDDNQVAAMPSLHIGWSTWCAVALLPVLRRRWTKALIVVYPFVTLLTVIVTANHYWLDGVGGLAVLGAGMGLETLRVHVRARAVGRPPPPSSATSSTHPADVEAEHLGVAGVDGRFDP